MSIEKQLIELPADRKGKFGEAVCMNVLKSSGACYIPLCDMRGSSAPMATNCEAKVILPDFDLVIEGVAAYLDAKVKTQSIRFRKTGQVRHGINAKNYEHYKKMGVIQKKECGLFIIELLDDCKNWSGSILVESFLGLGNPVTGFNEPTPKVYWPRERFCCLGSFTASQLIDIAKGRLKVDMTSLVTTRFSAPPPRCASVNRICEFVDMPLRDRRGWIKTECRKCGTFKGYRPPT